MGTNGTFQIYNLGTGTGYSVLEAVKAFEKVCITFQLRVPYSNCFGEGTIKLFQNSYQFIANKFALQKHI